MKKNYQQKKSGRFRYWTRKGYAAFSSLGRCVTIGQLRKNVTERALIKQAAPNLALSSWEVNPESEMEERGIQKASSTDIELLLPIVRPQIRLICIAEPYGSLLHNTNRGIDALNAFCDFALLKGLTKLQDAFKASIPNMTTSIT